MGVYSCKRNTLKIIFTDFLTHWYIQDERKDDDEEEEEEAKANSIMCFVLRVSVFCNCLPAWRLIANNVFYTDLLASISFPFYLCGSCRECFAHWSQVSRFVNRSLWLLPIVIILSIARLLPVDLASLLDVQMLHSTQVLWTFKHRSLGLHFVHWSIYLPNAWNTLTTSSFSIVHRLRGRHSLGFVLSNTAEIPFSETMSHF